MSNIQVPSFNLPEYKLDLSDYLFSPMKKRNEVVMIGEQKYSINKSKNKYVSIGILHDYNFAPCITIMSIKNDAIFFSEYEWKEFLTYFKQISSVRVLKISKDDSFVFLGYESVYKLWKLLLLKFRTEMMKQQQFITSFKVLQWDMFENESLALQIKYCNEEESNIWFKQ